MILTIIMIIIIIDSVDTSIQRLDDDQEKTDYSHQKQERRKEEDLPALKTALMHRYNDSSTT